MELKDVILSTLAEMEDEPVVDIQVSEIQKEASPVKEVQTQVYEDTKQETQVENVCESELMYLASIKERLLVLFEGFQAPNNTNIEAKIDMTLNFLEYTLATIDTRIEILEKTQK